MTRVSITLSAAVCLGLAACENQYIERKDTLTFGLGDAVSTNNAAMTADPWPRRSRNTRIPMDGVKVQQALAHYRGLGPNGANGNGANGNGDNGNGGNGNGGNGGYAPPPPH